MINDEVEDVSLRRLWKELKDENSISYTAFVKKMRRLSAGNVRTRNAISRQLGIEPQKPRVIRDFLSYDGEGYNGKYVLLANSYGDRIYNPEGLSSGDCLEFLALKYADSPKRVAFAFGYDVNNIIRDLPDDSIERLFRNQVVKWEGFRLKYVPGKIFSVNGITYYDTFSFFATNFINVVKRMLGEDRVTENLRQGKAARGEFESWNIEDIIKYNDEELQLLVEILDKLRDAFTRVGVHLTEWYGPGAVAKVWYKTHGVLPRDVLQDEVALALNSAYYGGRFEQVRLGRISPVWEYDIHSAYPSIMAEMPYFTTWRTARRYEQNKYSIWYVSFDLRGAINFERNKKKRIEDGFFPLPMRSKDGRICYPMIGKGWFWQSEIQNAIDFFPGGKVKIHKGFVANTEGRPFDWVKPLYDQRQELKQAGDLSEYAIKVGLNSLYGKTAQRVGRAEYFSLAWAGFITAEVRAKLARVGYEKGREKIIGFATDALFSTEKLDLPLSTDLGDWEEEKFDYGLFFQSGVYRLVKGQEHHDRYRGSPLRSGIDSIIEQLESKPHEYPSVMIGRFISHLLAIRNPVAYGQYRLQFIKVKYQLQMDAPYKRHYIGFDTRINDDGTIERDFSRMLTHEIRSLPKIWMGDSGNAYTFWPTLYSIMPFAMTESYPPPARNMEEMNLQHSFDESQSMADEVFTDIAELDELPVVEDNMT